MTELMNVTTVAKKLGKRRSFVERLLTTGALAGIDLTEAGKRRDIRVTPDALATYLTSVATIPQTPSRRAKPKKRRAAKRWV
ncbi:MAG: hypothetical protein GY903_00365 [Fuerstiella sp.]|nr:hypothetical protein [Fuerstiella sp.]MCP4852932.1 hypothetical protein [Fuerstiella sp.]